MAGSGQLIWTERMDYIGNQGHVQCEVLADEEVFAGDLFEYASERRKAVSARDDQHVLISLVWAMPIGKRCLQAFPELLFSDATHKTNQENRPLITFGVKDAEGRVQVVIRAWAPNERAWMFRWLFQTAVPAIIGKATFERIRLVLTDGDSQELTQLDAAISSVFMFAAVVVGTSFTKDGSSIPSKHWTNTKLGSHEVLNPLCKELFQLCDVAGKDKTAKTARDLESLIIALKEEIASQQSPPTGQVVSCMVSKVSRKRNHVKQSKY
ncbi:MULE transposase domain containing protein [Nitzschia inconspicua]|uniref:MULE transposase domain containing protein n=1 Tax=Nitzschia inconspicua TaxID=303405 RepID=A0A9K3PJ28_9STRA|nr:MULE transposase domain containing protein [Nitzschia inconspicua]